MTALTRRNFSLGALGATLATFVAGATPSSSGRRFLFMHATGGWDPLCVFAPMFSAPNIQMEPSTAPVSVAGFSLVDGPQRPSVVPFFQKWGGRTLLVNGLSTRSVNHETCQTVALTGLTSDSATDWPTMLAVEEAQAYYLPHLVLGGPAFPGAHTVHVSRAEGLVEEAINGSILGMVDTPIAAVGSAARRAVDGHLARRASSLAAVYPGSVFAADYGTAVSRSQALVDADIIAFPPVQDVRGQASNAIRALADGVARCATVAGEFVWDTHNNNADQSPLFESLFADLDFILTSLDSTTSADGRKLSEDTVVVVLSEMGRTPAYNATQGRDHWPYTSALVIGPGITGGRTIGGYSDLYVGIGADPASGELDPNRVGIDAKSLGATLLALGGVDPGKYIISPEVIEGVLT